MYMLDHFFENGLETNEITLNITIGLKKAHQFEKSLLKNENSTTVRNQILIRIYFSTNHCFPTFY